MVKFTLDERIERARQLHKAGYNCSQCVFMVFDDIHNLDITTAAKVSSGFGGGVGGQRQICGAISGMTMIVGMVQYASPSDKSLLYRSVQELSNEFKNINSSTICGELLKSGRKPCMELIEDAIAIIDKNIR